MGRNSAIVDHSATELARYTWSFPGSPVRVKLRLAVVERLQKPDAESDGVLLGKTAGQTTEIDDFQPLPGAQPPSADAVAVAVATAAAARVMGYYRITREPALRLNESDLKLMESVFPARHQVFLLIQQTESGPANATFFFWEEGRICGDFPFLEFPLDAELLATAEQHRTETLQKKLTEQAGRRDREPDVHEEPPPRPKVTAKVLFWGFAGALVVFLCLTAVLAVKWLPEKYWPNRAVTPGALPAAALREAFFGLQAERQNADLKLTWNRESSVVLSATSGVLAIDDGGSTRKIILDPLQVRSGSILYAPLTDQVQMQLSVLTPQGTISESVLVIVPKAGAPKLHMVAQQLSPMVQIEDERQPAGNTPAVPLKPFTAPEITENAPIPAAMNQPPPPSVRPETMAALPAALRPRLTPVPPPLTAAPGSATAVSRQPVYYGPEVLSKMIPPFPSYLRTAVMKTTAIEIKVSIDANGKVVKAEPVLHTAGHPALVAAATNAARLWKFKPAHKDQEPISSELVLQFLFRVP